MNIIILFWRTQQTHLSYWLFNQFFYYNISVYTYKYSSYCWKDKSNNYLIGELNNIPSYIYRINNYKTKKHLNYFGSDPNSITTSAGGSSFFSSSSTNFPCEKWLHFPTMRYTQYHSMKHKSNITLVIHFDMIHIKIWR